MNDPAAQPNRHAGGEPLPADSYPLLRYLTSPVVAITTSAQGRRNGLIVNSAQRASLVPTYQRVSIYVSKLNFSHDLIWRSGVFGLHLLHRGQFDIVERLGLRSGRDGDKMEGLALVEGAVTGCPLLADARAAYECRVVNAMDAGAATFFLGDVVAMRDAGAGAVMTSDWFRAHMPEALRQRYEANLAVAQELLAPLAGHVDRAPWPGPGVAP
jgi:flavin reductase (DIM6/NTAB) family NADH-FMN oxidoreductase RutF